MITVPNIVVFSALCGTALGLDPLGQVSFSQRLLIATGLITILQSLKGHRYPLLEGPSAAALLSFIVLAPYGLPAIGGGMICGGILLILVWKLKLFRWLSALFTPQVVGIIIMLISLSLLPVVYPLLIGIDKAHPYGQMGIAGSSFLILMVMALLSYWLKGFLQTTSLLLGILIGFFFFALQGDISFDVVGEASWLALPSPLWGGWPVFLPAPVLAMTCTYLAVLTNTVGSIQAISEVTGKEKLDDRIHKGIGMTGLGTVGTAFFGVVGLVPHSISVGVVLVTRVASRYALTASGIIMIICAFIPKLWALFMVIPSSVIAAAFLVVLTSQVAAGINSVMNGRTKLERREYFTVGLPLLMGALVAIIPRPFFQFFPSALAALIGNGLVVGIIFALICEHLIFRRRE